MKSILFKSGAISYVTREARESKDPSLGGKYPVFVIDNVNHAQGTTKQTNDIMT